MQGEDKEKKRGGWRKTWKKKGDVDKWERRG